MYINRQSLIRRFRRVAWGRLYWKYPTGKRNSRFHRDDICIVRNGPLTTHYKTMQAFIRDLTEQEIENNIGEK